MLVSQEVYTRQDALFNQTIYPASDADKRKLIPIKNNTSRSMSMAAIVEK